MIRSTIPPLIDVDHISRFGRLEVEGYEHYEIPRQRSTVEAWVTDMESEADGPVG